MRRGPWGCPILVALGLLAAPDAVSAWGSDAHRAMGEIASHYLTPRARREVAELLEPGAYGTLAGVGCWADLAARRDPAYDEYLRRHSVSADPDAEGVVLARDCPEDCILTAIEGLIASLREREASCELRARDFRFLVHFVEDLHQPLHVSHPDGRGGNLTEVRVFGEEMNLHSAWDWGLIKHRLEDYEGEAESDPDPIDAWELWAFELRLEIGPAEVERWSTPLDPLAWANESLEDARRLTFDVRSGDGLGETYYEAALPVIEERLKMGAVRLAALLNDIFDHARGTGHGG